MPWDKPIEYVGAILGIIAFVFSFGSTILGQVRPLFFIYTQKRRNKEISRVSKLLEYAVLSPDSSLNFEAGIVNSLSFLIKGWCLLSSAQVINVVGLMLLSRSFSDVVASSTPVNRVTLNGLLLLIPSILVPVISFVFTLQGGRLVTRGTAMRDVLTKRGEFLNKLEARMKNFQKRGFY